MAQVELTFIVEHADLYRDANENLVVHLLAEKQDVLDGITAFEQAIAPVTAQQAAPAVELVKTPPVEPDNGLTVEQALKQG